MNKSKIFVKSRKGFIFTISDIEEVNRILIEKRENTIPISRSNYSGITIEKLNNTWRNVLVQHKVLEK